MGAFAPDDDDEDGDDDFDSGGYTDSGSGDDALLTATASGRPWAALRQFSVFMENHVGNLTELMRFVECADLKVVAITITDSVDFGVIRLIFDNYERAHERLRLSEYTVAEADVLAIELPDEEQPFVAVTRPLLRAEVSIHYAYPLMWRRNGRGVVALYVDDLDAALRAVEPTGLTVITEQDLTEDGF